jgi:hypothetical protein
MRRRLTLSLSWSLCIACVNVAFRLNWNSSSTLGSEAFSKIGLI